ncbi:hypothetical protein BGZ65_001826 [Modicella reniformis]|uniref:F-box domain-containing protein n=1 Tax=Modicella reniformis TaxID=1440133 RepID=A0A9P6M0E9_9FUNG|nr:hypothetical protein BGZ65_001826 [Modicella reniformis]
MFGLPELDNMICRELSQHDLAQCVRVNRKWHMAVIPYLWRDIRCGEQLKRREALRRMVLEDYLYEQQHQQTMEEKDESSVEEHTQTPLSSLSPLARKYGPCIRMLPGPIELLGYFHSPRGPTGIQQSSTQRDKESAQLLHHLYKHSPAIQVPHLYLNRLESLPHNVVRTIAEFVIFRVHFLTLGGVLHNWKSKFLLDRCSNALEELTLRDRIASDEDNNGQEEQQQQCKTWESLEELTLEWCRDNSVSKSFWSWLCRRCCHVKRLKASKLQGIAQSLANGMLTYMPNLSEITLGSGVSGILDLTDDDVAALLSGSRNGWKVVKVEYSAEFGDASGKALKKHSPTLEELVVYGCNGVTDSDLVQVLSISPNLHTLISIEDAYYERGNYPCFQVERFIDRYPFAGSLRTWACESSLTVLKVKLTDIPGRDRYGCVPETYPGQGREIQNQVYDRLARLINLKSLWLGHRPLISYGGRMCEEREYQLNCLEMSLESGLHKLAGLKSLEELNVWGMDTKIGLKEVQWMTGHWPRLHAIFGLDDRCNKESGIVCGHEDGDCYDEIDDKEAVEWLWKHYPEIELTSSWFYYYSG